MRTTWLHRHSSETLILFYAGWGLDDADIRHLHSDRDVLMLHDYRREDFDDGLIAAYRHIDIIAYSMGVAVAARGRQSLRPRSATAICGTTTPRLSIGADLYERTMTELCPRSFGRFLRRAGARAPRSADIAALRFELHQLADRSATAHPPFDQVIGCTEDRIFTRQAMEQAWRGKNAITWKSGPHMPFAQWQSWQEILP